jgi:ACS family tartrate transporter-like MFS transporter
MSAFSPYPVLPASTNPIDRAALDRARRKAYWRISPLLFLAYVIAYVDRANISLAKLTMLKDLHFDNAVIGTAFGVFFWGYFLLEIPCALAIEKWSARRLICRIMVSWGIIAALTALVKTPGQFYTARFFLGVAEAGFFPGVLIYLTHWFPLRDRARAMAWFMIATPAAQILSPKISGALLQIGTEEIINGLPVHHPAILGLVGWQWLYIFWGLPAVALGILVYFTLSDRPADAHWLTPEEKQALIAQLELEKAQVSGRRRMTVFEAFKNPKVLWLMLAYFFGVTANYGYESFLPSILNDWYSLKMDSLTSLVILPPCFAVASQLFIGWSSDRHKEYRRHAAYTIFIGLAALLLAPLTRGHLPLTIACFIVFSAGQKGYQPAFWALPGLFLTEMAAAGSIGLINSVAQIGGFVGPYVLGTLQTHTNTFVGGIYFLCACMAAAGAIILSLRVKPVPVA